MQKGPNPLLSEVEPEGCIAFIFHPEIIMDLEWCQLNRNDVANEAAFDSVFLLRYTVTLRPAQFLWAADIEPVEDAATR